MNRLIKCASLAALGAASLHAQTPDPSGKPWSVSAKIRGFYDDNYNTAPEPLAQSSWGVNVAPSLAYQLLRDQTSLGVQYDFDARWYESRVDNEVDYTHHGQVSFAQSFSERFKLDVIDSLVYASEPSVIEPSMPATFARTENDAWRNYAAVGINGRFTEKFGSRLGYSNSIYDYLQDGTASRSALLDRMEHLISGDLRWQFQPTIVGLTGYQYGRFNYSSSDALYDPTWYGFPAGTVVPTGESRDQESHYGFVGLDYTATPQLTGQLRGGVNYARYPNLKTDDLLAPYVDLGISYEYLQGSKVTVGVKHDIRPTDVATPNPADKTGQSITLSQEATTVYAMISQKIVEKLRGNLRGSWQNAEYQGGRFDGAKDNYYTVDVSLEYAFTRNFSAEVGYAFDKLDSDVDHLGNLRGYDRNRAYLGVKASY